MSLDKQVSDFLGPVVDSLEPGELKKLQNTIANDIRKSTRQSINAQQTPEGQAWEARKAERRAVKPRKMFVRLKLNTFLRIRNKPGQVVLGWENRTGRIANIHHHGGTDSTNDNARYPARELIGITSAHEALIERRIIEHISAK